MRTGLILFLLFSAQWLCAQPTFTREIVDITGDGIDDTVTSKKVKFINIDEGWVKIVDGSNGEKLTARKEEKTDHFLSVLRVEGDTSKFPGYKKYFQEFLYGKEINDELVAPVKWLLDLETSKLENTTSILFSSTSYYPDIREKKTDTIPRSMKGIYRVSIDQLQNGKKCEVYSRSVRDFLGYHEPDSQRYGFLICDAEGSVNLVLDDTASHYFLPPSGQMKGNVKRSAHGVWLDQGDSIQWLMVDDFPQYRNTWYRKSVRQIAVVGEKVFVELGRRKCTKERLAVIIPETRKIYYFKKGIFAGVDWGSWQIVGEELHIGSHIALAQRITMKEIEREIKKIEENEKAGFGRMEDGR